MIVLFAIFICPESIIFNYTKVWNKLDNITLTNSMNKCAELYINNPCLSKFVKLKEDTYQVICGEIK